MDKTLIVMPGSPFVMRAMTALNTRQVPYYLHWVDLANIKDKLPPPATVPFLCDGDTVVSDSTDILKYLEKQGLPDGKPFGLYPNDEAIKLDEELMKELSLIFFYIALVRKESWEKALKKSVAKNIPWFVQAIGITPEKLTQERRAKTLNEIQQRSAELGFDPSKGEEAYDAMVKSVFAKYEKLLVESKSSGPYLLSNKVPNPDLPTAADCGLFGFLQRVYGTSGDVNFPCSWPELLNDFPEMQRFFKDMNEKYPIQFKGRRRPEGSTRLPIPQLYSKPPIIPSQLRNYLFG